MVYKFILEYGFHILALVLTGIISYIGLCFKRGIHELFQKWALKDTVEMVCRAILELYPNLSYEEQYNDAIINLDDILLEKKIIVSDIEKKMLVMSTFHHIRKDNVSWE